jgi:hypothetical protein
MEIRSTGDLMAERPGPDPERVRETLKEERETVERETDEGPAPEELDEDPAYNPDDPGLKRVKGS